MIAVFFVFRMRFYAAWCGAEAGCISAGLGCYPERALCKPGGGPSVNYRYPPLECLHLFDGQMLIVESLYLFLIFEYPVPCAQF